MKVSVIIPIFNGADFVLKSYQSIINQNLIDFELIYVNNNSTDSTEDEIKTLQHKDARIHYFFQPKQGAAPARNMGIKKAKGDYVYVFDVDDEIYPNALNRMIHVLDGYPNVDAVFGKMVKSYNDILDTEKPIDETNEVILKDPPYWGIHWFSSLRHVVGPPAFLYRKKVFDKIGFYNEDLKNDEDTALDIKLGMTSNVAFLDTYVYLYFKHHNSTIQQTKKKGRMIFHTWNRYTKEHLPFYLENDVPFRFKEILFGQLFGSMGKLICHTNSFKKRKQQMNDIQNDIKPLLVPIFIKLYLTILVFLPHKPLLKFYVYYLSPWYVNKQLKTQFKFKKH